MKISAPDPIVDGSNDSLDFVDDLRGLAPLNNKEPIQFNIIE